MKSLKTIAIIQARMNSSRFPKKVLKLINGKPIIEYIVNYLSQSRLIDKIVIATTTLPIDDEIELLAIKLKTSCFRGSSSDVLNRFFECAKFHNADIIVRVTADDPLIDPNIIDLMITNCKNNDCDYSSNVLHQTFPVGFTACEVFTFNLLKSLNKNALDSKSREHVTSQIIANPSLYKIKEILAEPSICRPNWRLTIDYYDDFLLIEKIITSIDNKQKFISYDELVKFLDENNHLLNINKKFHTKNDKTKMSLYGVND